MDLMYIYSYFDFHATLQVKEKDMRSQITFIVAHVFRAERGNVLYIFFFVDGAIEL